MHHSDSATVTTVDTLAKLLDVCGELHASEQVDERAVTGCSFDSRAVSAGDVFFCKGAAFKPAFLSMALDAGAVAFVCEESLVESLEPLAKENGAAMLVVDSVRTAMALLPPEVYNRPDHDVKIVGITGTKGKTTAAFMLQSIIKAAGESCGMIGSVNTDDGIECYESTNTTPEAPEVWRHIANCRASGRQSMVMEVSSQALKYQRVENLPFDVACFLNIGRDHISPIEHPTFEDYFESKLRIFDQAKTAVVNLGTDEVERVLEAASTAERLVTVGVEHPEASLWASDVRMVGFNIEFNLHGMSADKPEAGRRSCWVSRETLTWRTRWSLSPLRARLASESMPSRRASPSCVCRAAWRSWSRRMDAWFALLTTLTTNFRSARSFCRSSARFPPVRSLRCLVLLEARRRSAVSSFRARPHHILIC